MSDRRLQFTWRGGDRRRLSRRLARISLILCGVTILLLVATLLLPARSGAHKAAAIAIMVALIVVAMVIVNATGRMRPPDPRSRYPGGIR